MKDNELMNHCGLISVERTVLVQSHIHTNAYQLKLVQNRCITLAFTTQVQPGQDVNTTRGIPHKEALINAYT